MPQPERVRQHRIVYPDGSTFPRDKNKLLFKSETVFQVIRAYANNHTYAEIKNIFGGVRDNDATGRGYQNDCIMILDQVPQELGIRFNMDRPITSSDDIKFVVNTNWGNPMPGDRDCWGAFQDAAKAAGYIIETI